MAYDKDIDDYIKQNNRLGLREVIKADAGYKTLEEFYFMRDMLQSDKRYLIDQSGNKYEVRVSSENFSHDLFPTEPGSVPLNVRFVDIDTNHSPIIDEGIISNVKFYLTDNFDNRITDNFGNNITVQGI